MASGDASANIVLTRKENIVTSLCKHLSLDPKTFLDSIVENDIKSVCANILKSLRTPPKNGDEVSKWISFAESFPVDSEACLGVLPVINEELARKSVLMGDGLKPSEADVIVFSLLHPFVIGLPNTERQKLPHLVRWMDYIQSKENLGELFQKISLENNVMEFPRPKPIVKVEADPNAKKTVQSTKKADNIETNPSSKKSDTKKKVTGDPAADKDNKKLPEKEAAEKDKEVSISLLNIQVGLIRKAWKHPSADSLLVEEIDVGDAKLRQVVSGLAKYCSPEELTNHHVVLITNVKPGKLRDVMSEGLVLCASNEDHTVVEPLLPPEGARLGERISFSGNDGKPEDVLNPKKKQLEKITPHLFTDDKGVATFKGIPFMTSGGPCTSSIPKASIK